MTSTARVTFAKITPAKGTEIEGSTQYVVMLDGEQVGTVERYRETSTVAYAGVNYGRPVTSTRWTAATRTTKSTANGKTLRFSDYQHTSRTGAVASLLSWLLGISHFEAERIVKTK